jgi:hypothetical protein
MRTAIFITVRSDSSRLPNKALMEILGRPTIELVISRAKRVKNVGSERGYKIEIDHFKNPRVEKEDHYYNPHYTGLLELGLTPHYLTDNVLHGMFEIVEQFKEQINKNAIFRGVQWK